MAPNEVLVAVQIPFTRQLEFTMPFKQARRREDDISIVTGGIRILLGVQSTQGYFIKDARIAFGGLAPTTILGAHTCLCTYSRLLSYLLAENVLKTFYFLIKL